MSGEISLLRRTLKLVHLFEGFSEEDARDLLAYATRFDARRFEPIVRENELGEDMFVVAAGRLKVVKSSRGGDELLATPVPGDSFGEIALLDSGPRSASVVAVTASTLLRFERKNLVKIPEVARKLYRNVATMVASRLRDTCMRVVLSKTAKEPPAGRVRGMTCKSNAATPRSSAVWWTVSSAPTRGGSSVEAELGIVNAGDLRSGHLRALVHDLGEYLALALYHQHTAIADQYRLSGRLVPVPVLDTIRRPSGCCKWGSLLKMAMTSGQGGVSRCPAIRCASRSTTVTASVCSFIS